MFISLSLVACIIAFASLDGKISGINILKNFVWNLPICLLAGFFDYKIIMWSHRWFSSFSVWSVLMDLFISNLLLSVLSIINIYISACLWWEVALRIPQQLILSTFCNSVIVLTVEVFYYNQQYLENKARLATIEKEKAQYQFEALKNQINPHFLFNSLNVLSSLAYQNAGKANMFAKKLSSVYRYLLATQELMKVPLQDELDFVESYVYLEQIRFGDTLCVHLSQEGGTEGKYIVPASIQMLVENALKHNINTKESPLRIGISVGEKNVCVTNNLQLRQSVNKNQVGLKNLEKQYRIHGLHIDVRKSGTEFTVILPLL